MGGFNIIDFDTPPDLIRECWKSFECLGCEVRKYLQAYPPVLPALSKTAVPISELDGDLTYPLCFCGVVKHADPDLNGMICFYRRDIDLPLLCRIVVYFPDSPGRFIQYMMIAFGVCRPFVGSEPGGLPEKFDSIYLLPNDRDNLQFESLLGGLELTVVDEKCIQGSGVGCSHLEIRQARLECGQATSFTVMCGSLRRARFQPDTCWLAMERRRSMFASRRDIVAMASTIGRVLRDAGAYPIDVDAPARKHKEET